MARYFIDFQDGGRPTVEDNEGEDFGSLTNVREQTIDLLLRMACGVPPTDDSGQMVAVARDESGLTVYRATLTFRGEWPQPLNEPNPILPATGG